MLLDLARQVEIVRSGMPEAQDGDVQRTLDELSETVRELAGLKDALARWSKESAALLSAGKSR